MINPLKVRPLFVENGMTGMTGMFLKRKMFLKVAFGRCFVWPSVESLVPRVPCPLPNAAARLTWFVPTAMVPYRLCSELAEFRELKDFCEA